MFSVGFRPTGNPHVNNIVLQGINKNYVQIVSVHNHNGNVATGNGNVSASSGPTDNDGNVNNLPIEDSNRHPHQGQYNLANCIII